MTSFEPPTIADVRQAAGRIAGMVVRTPLLESTLLNRRLGARLLFKPECLQRTGSFKIRGASNFMAAMTAAERARGVVSYSSGNHAQAVAAAAHAAGVSAKIVMPTNAPRIKLESTKAWGAEVVTYDRATGDRQAIAEGIAKAEGRVIAPPFDHPLIIAGQGTVGLEIAEDLRAQGIAPDLVAVPCGGGGLVSGLSLAIKDAFPNAAIHAVEPEANDDTVRSMRSGERQRADLTRASICDSLLTAMPGALTFAINRRLLAGVVTVSDDEVPPAMRLAFEYLKVVVEPGGSVGLAAAMAGRFAIAGKTVVIVLSGGNVDAERYAECLRG